MEAADVLWPSGQGKGGQLLTILVIPIARRSGGWPLILSGPTLGVPPEAPSTGKSWEVPNGPDFVTPAVLGSR